jgi:hypothetical protein
LGTVDPNRIIEACVEQFGVIQASPAQVGVGKVDSSQHGTTQVGLL